MRATESLTVPPTPSQLVTLDGDHLVTDSRIVAKRFGKTHKNVLQAYDLLRCSEGFSRLNFQPSEYRDSRGKMRRQIIMTKDGFTMLAMGFTGPQAMQFKEDYINAFNAMAEQVANGEKNLWQKIYELDAQDAASHVKASFGSHLMLSRKRELPRLRTQRKELESEIQPKLSFH